MTLDAVERFVTEPSVGLALALLLSLLSGAAVALLASARGARGCRGDDARALAILTGPYREPGERPPLRAPRPCPTSDPAAHESRCPLCGAPAGLPCAPTPLPGPGRKVRC